MTNPTFSQEINSDIIQSKSNNNPPSGLKKNAIYLSGGTLGSSYGFFNGNYERMLWGNKHPTLRSVYIRASIGKFKGEALSGFIAYSTYKATTYMATLGCLVGKRSSFLEFGLGAMYATGTESQTSGWTGKETNYGLNGITPAVNLGYRYQKPGGHFVFRAGLGFYEVYYISLGFCL